MKDKLIMLKLFQRQWVGQRFDGSKSAKITADSGAESGAARLNKQIVPKSVINPTKQHFAAMKSWFYDQTSPFYDSGWRVRPIHDFSVFRDEYAKLKNTAESLVSDLISNTYPKALEHAEQRMGELYNSADYPNPEELRQHFEITLDMQPIPEVSHNWLTKLDEDTKDIVEDTTKRSEENVKNEPWLRLHEPLSRLHKTLLTRIGEHGSVFRSTSFQSLTSTCKTALSLSTNPNDTNLTDVIFKITSEVVPADVKALRKDDAYRKHIASKVKNILTEIGNNL